jgi:hypothetical protein
VTHSSSERWMFLSIRVNALYGKRGVSSSRKRLTKTGRCLKLMQFVKDRIGLHLSIALSRYRYGDRQKIIQFMEFDYAKRP